MLRRSLGRQLRALRKAVGLGYEGVRKVGSRDKIWRMETGKGPYAYSDIVGLCHIYKADPVTTARLVELGDKIEAGGESIYEDYSDVLPTWVAAYFELEAAASVSYMFDPEVVPGPLQTADYARAVFRAGRQAAAPDVIERQVIARMERAEGLFGRTPPVRIEAVLGAGVLARQVGGPDVMAAQKAHLRRLVNETDVRVSVLTWEAGAHAAMEGAFNLLDFDDPEDPSVVYLESYAGAQYLEKPRQVVEYREIFHLVQQQATALEEYVR